MLQETSEKIKRYLQNDLSDYWNVSVKKDKIVASFCGEKRFTLEYDEDFEDWYFSGEEVALSIVKGVYDVLETVQERGL